jgi:hypothetical protein
MGTQPQGVARSTTYSCVTSGADLRGLTIVKRATRATTNETAKGTRNAKLRSGGIGAFQSTDHGLPEDS